MYQPKVNDVVTIHRGTRQFDVVEVDTLDGGQSRIWPREPLTDEDNGRWVGNNLLHKVEPADILPYPDED